MTENIINENSKETHKNVPLNKNENLNNINNPSSTVQKYNKRKRRKKIEITNRAFKCPDCEKCYVTSSALITHKKIKHNYITVTGNRGRPNSNSQEKKNNQANPLRIYKIFFTREITKKNKNEIKTIELSFIKNILNGIFWKNKYDLFFDIDTVGKYSFYEFISNNWEKREYVIENYENNPGIKKDKKFNLDEIFLIYIKDISKKVNIKYFPYIIKFVILFRKYINDLKKDLLKNIIQDDKKNYYSQVFNAENIPEESNGFITDFMEKNNYFEMNKNEVFEITQNFCCWLYLYKFSQYYLIKP